MRINAERLWQRLETLSTFTDPERPWTRRAFTDLHQRSRRWLASEMAEAGLAAAVDAGGNLVGRLAGQRNNLAPLATGSHADTVPDGGRYDGIFGVIAGIEVLQTLKERNIELQHPVEVIDFLSEEPSDYGISCVGSRAMVGLLEPEMLEAKNGSGETLAEGLRRVGGAPERLTGPLRKPGDIAAFVELHIEQGRVLETHRLPIGVVTHIVGIRRYEVVVDGQADHAGTTPMDLRRDALVGAAAFIEGVNRAARNLAQGDAYLVATVGRIEVAPNAANAIANRVVMVLEVRSDDQELMDRFIDPVLADLRPRLETDRLSINIRPVSKGVPTVCSDLLQDEIEAAAVCCGYETMRMPSGAGHDAVYVSRIAPVGMIFTPCLNGRSHCPEEWLSPEQAAAGAEVLLESLLRLDRYLAGV